MEYKDENVILLGRQDGKCATFRKTGGGVIILGRQGGKFDTYRKERRKC